VTSDARCGAAVGRTERRVSRPIVTLLVVGVSGCGGGGDAPSVLDPASPDADRVAELWWVLFTVSAVVVAAVTAILLVATRRRRSGAVAVDRRPVRWGDRSVVLGGVVLPGVILLATFVYSLTVLRDVASSEDPDFAVDVVAHNWWWEVRYPNGAVTANEIHIPAGEAVELSLSTADVIHSLWVPELQVKMDLVPGADNRLGLEAERPGRFRGQCAEFCGLQHARMAFVVVAHAPGDFAAWLERESAAAPEPSTADSVAGREIFLGSSCAGCHAVRGTSAVGVLGPDLTHVASRATIGAGLFRLDRDSLADFVGDPQDDKPGATMPRAELTPAEVDAVVSYLMELE
jgi:cytochrome c oxidase subunit II